MGWPSHACAPGIQGMSLQLTSHLQGNRKRKGGRSLSLNNVRTRIKDRRHRVAHSPYPQLFSPLPTFPHYIPRAHIYFFHPPHRAGGIFSIQLWRGQDRTTSVGTPRSWLPSVSDQTLAVKSTRKTQPSLPFSLFLKEEAPHSHPDTPSQTQYKMFAKSSDRCVHVQRLCGWSLRKI